MLAFAFFVSIFSSLLWLFYALMYISENLNGVSASTLGIMDMSIYVSFVVLPIFVIWIVFGFINQFITNRFFNKNLYSLFVQMKKSQDYTDLMARIMLESEQQIKDGFVLGNFDLFIADMNELLAELIHRSNIASNEQIERLWNKVQNGGKWSFGKVIIEVNQNQPNFQNRVFEKAQDDAVLSGTILEFCARYLSLIALLEKHDRERIFLNIVETGVLGKVFSIFAPISDEVKKFREVSFRKDSSLSKTKFSSNSFDSTEEIELDSNVEENERPKPAIKSFVSKIGLFKKKNENNENREKNEPQLNERDSFSMALERSFGNSEPQFNEPQISDPNIEFPKIELPTFGVKIEEPSFDSSFEEPKFSDNSFTTEPLVSTNEEPKFFTEKSYEKTFESPVLESKELMVENNFELTSTQRTLDNLKKEWDEMKKADEPRVSIPQEVQTPIAKTAQEETYSYPFGGWTDEDNYHK